MLHYKSKYNGEAIAGKDRCGLKPGEQEFCVFFSAESAEKGFAEVGSHIPALTEALLSNPHFKLNKNGLELSGEKRVTVVGASGKIPVSALLIKSPRKTNRLEDIISVKR